MVRGGILLMARVLAKIQSENSELNRFQDHLISVLNPILRVLPSGIGPTGTATLVNGTKLVYVANLKEASKVFVSNVNPSTTLGDWVITNQAGVGFTVTSSSATDDSTFNWWVIGI